MYEKTIIVSKSYIGHSRPCNDIVNIAKMFSCEILIKTVDRTANAKSIMSLMMLCITELTDLTIMAKGSKEDVAVQLLAGLIESNSTPSKMDEPLKQMFIDHFPDFFKVLLSNEKNGVPRNETIDDHFKRLSIEFEKNNCGY